jgi:hypothetical protein
MIKIIFILIFLLISINIVYAEEVLITYTPKLQDVKFDGAWSHTTEWKPSSLVMIKNNNTSFAYRVAHDYENLFVYVSATSDKSPSKSTDRAIVCIDGENNGGEKPDMNDYCFISIMGTDKIYTLQGGSYTGQNGFYKIIDNHTELIGVGAVSTEFDKYSKIPHSSYEFKIPIEIFGRSNIYGLYVGVFDSNTSNQYGWPQEARQEKYPFIPSPKLWGQMISPDKTIPEFGIPLVMLFSTLIFLVFISKRKMSVFKFSKY